LELEFRDRSVITFTGGATLSFADRGQKEIHLKEGTLTGSVQPQRPQSPMLVYTRVAVLEVRGTRFEVESHPASTRLDVHEGNVRLRRLNDGRTVNVAGRQRLLVAADRPMEPVRVPEPVTRWKSRLAEGPAFTMGRWMSRSSERKARLETIPYACMSGQGRLMTLYAAGFGVSCGDGAPVILNNDSWFRVKGRVKKRCDIYFGVTLRQRTGEFAGKFQTIKRAGEFEVGEPFTVNLRVSDFHLDPSLSEMASRLPSRPFPLVVESFWTHSLEQQAGLAITEVTLASGSGPGRVREPTSK
jgi:hypothetical protein